MVVRVEKGEAVEVECPFCLRPLFAIADPQQIIHARPACDEFEARTAEEVIAALQRPPAGN